MMFEGGGNKNTNNKKKNNNPGGLGENLKYIILSFSS